MEKGLTTVEAEKKIKTFGKNEINIHEDFSFVFLFLSQFPTLINGVLAIAAIFSFFIKNIIDAFFIFLILFLNAVLGFIQEYRAEKALKKLKNYIIPMSRVLRDGKEVQLKTEELVPEDLVVLQEGDRIPADGRIIHCHQIEVDESILTGESIPSIKKENDQIFSGTLITKGRGTLLVEKTGLNTRFGEIAKTLSTLKQDKTPLMLKLDNLGKVLSLIIIFISFSIILIGTLQGKSLFPLILLAVSIGVAAIPEGLPAITTIALSLGTSKMAKIKAIVRKMQSIETLGAVQIILIDKTGTLTQNLMRVKEVFVNNQENLNNLLRACVIGNTACLIKKANNDGFDVIGDKTDGALLLFADSKINNLDHGKVVDEYVFDPATKTITTVYETGGTKQVFVRGAPEEILEKSKLNNIEKEKIKNKFEDYAKKGLRVIGFGFKPLNQSHNLNHDRKTREEILEKDLDFLGFVGIYDPPRIEAKQAVKNAKTAGIKTIMVTGDNEQTALAISKEVGLIEENEDVITGDELNRLSDEELEKIIINTRIFARTKPEDKLRLVELFKKQGFVVGVTGDGVNDALALKRADVGIAMGESGTEVAKEASDIVLADDNFQTLVSAIEEGRNIYNNILKAITYLLSGNLSELSLVFIAVIFGLPNPLLPTQILWINLITDGIPALALASDTKNPNILNYSPRNPKSGILTKNRIIFISLVGFSSAIILISIFKLLLENNSETFARTVVFNLLVIIHMLIVFLVRGKHIFQKNNFLMLAVLGTLILQIIITTTPFFQQIFHLGF